MRVTCVHPHSKATPPNSSSPDFFIKIRMRRSSYLFVGSVDIREAFRCMFATVAIGDDDASVLGLGSMSCARTNMRPGHLTRVDSHSDTQSPGLITAATRRPRSPVAWQEDGTVPGRFLAAVMGPPVEPGEGARCVVPYSPLFSQVPFPADRSVLGLHPGPDAAFLGDAGPVGRDVGPAAVTRRRCGLGGCGTAWPASAGPGHGTGGRVRWLGGTGSSFRQGVPRPGAWLRG
jgi:hypothetical protein